MTMIEECAAFIAARRLAGRDIADLPAGLKPASQDDGYAVQAAVTRRLLAAGRGPLVGWKLGVTTRRMQELINMDGPGAGAMLADGRHDSPATVSAATFTRLGIECEIAFVMGARLTGPVSRQEAAAAVSHIHPAIELVDNRYGDFRSFGAPGMIADAMFHAGFVLGPAVAAWRDIDLAAVTGTTVVNGAPLLQGRGAEVLGHPLESVRVLAAVLGRQGLALEPGQVVMAGSLPLPHWAREGEHIEARLEGLGSAMVTVNA
ncbi:MAG: fumarylacetoacetate hydrolase family protein [Thalassobaculales bacterium]